MSWPGWAGSLCSKTAGAVSSSGLWPRCSVRISFSLNSGPAGSEEVRTALMMREFSSLWALWLSSEPPHLDVWSIQSLSLTSFGIVSCWQSGMTTPLHLLQLQGKDSTKLRSLP